LAAIDPAYRLETAWHGLVAWAAIAGFADRLRLGVYADPATAYA
jgi:hypothetical protein